MTQAQALAILKTGANVFLTGEPGAGKTYTVNSYIAYLRAYSIEPAITAATGIAATHIGGMTIHSWGGLGIRSKLTAYDLDAIATNEYVSKRVRLAKVLIIDEVSMLSPETFAMAEAVCRAVRANAEPFGGLQVILVGDFFQLPPIVKAETESSAQATLLTEKPARFAYDSAAWARLNPVVCYLTEQHRQDDSEYLALLSAIRANEFGDIHLNKIVARKIDFKAAPESAPKLFSHNVDVDRVNEATLAKLPGKSQLYRMETRGPKGLVAALQKGCLSPEKLTLKIGAAVMFTKNNPRAGYVNGTLGTVTAFAQFSGHPVVATRSGAQIEVGPVDWKVEESGVTRATLTQLPLRLAWAITVHKSQGMSLDEAVMDLSGVFEFGQGYVALSRVRRLSGVHLLGWNERAFMVHPEALEKDIDFRAAADAAARMFGQLAPAELNKMHRDFIIANGGVFKKAVEARKANKNSGSFFAPGGPARLDAGSASGWNKLRETHPNAYRPWSEEQDKKLGILFSDCTPVKELAKKFGRKSGAIRSRLVKLGLISVEGQ